MSLLADRRYLKMNGLGNEIVVVDLRGVTGEIEAQAAAAVAERRESRFDQLMAIHDPRSPEADARLVIYNADGSRAGACGNGTRCVGWAMLQDSEMARSPVSGEGLLLESAGGALVVTRDGPEVFTADMGAPRLRWDEIPLAEPFADTRAIELQIGPIDAPTLHSPSVVSMGNPHAVFFVQDPAAYDLARLGPMLENHPIFPDRANISLAAVRARDHIELRVWERGAGLTRACGSAACAALVAAVRGRLTDRRATVTLPGGDLVIAWREEDGHVLMTGPVELEHEGRFPAAMFPAEGRAAG